jgi:hypothetical protein
MELPHHYEKEALSITFWDPSSPNDAEYASGVLAVGMRRSLRMKEIG